MLVGDSSVGPYGDADPVEAEPDGADGGDEAGNEPVDVVGLPVAVDGGQRRQGGNALGVLGVTTVRRSGVSSGSAPTTDQPTSKLGHCDPGASAYPKQDRAAAIPLEQCDRHNKHSQ